MPKKFQGENSKAAEARARKDAVATEKRIKKEKEEEDKLWEDNDKLVLRKQERKEDKEKKHQEAMLRKAEREKQLEEEMNSLKGAKPSVAKVTKSQIEAEREREALHRLQTKTTPLPKGVVTPEHEEVIPENVNRAAAEGDVARDVDQALKLLGVSDDLDKHPEKRAKAAFLAFEERELPRLTAEYPTFRLSQLKQMLKTQWQKSPENPFNKPIQKYNASKADAVKE